MSMIRRKKIEESLLYYLLKKYVFNINVSSGEERSHDSLVIGKSYHKNATFLYFLFFKFLLN